MKTKSGADLNTAYIIAPLVTGGLSVITFLAINFLYPHTNGVYPDQINTLLLISVIVGASAFCFFILGLVYSIYLYFSPKKGRPSSFLLGILLLVILNVTFFLLMYSFLIDTNGLSFDEKAKIGLQNLWRIVFFYAFFTSIYTFIAFWRKFFRGVAAALILFWVAGTFVVYMINQYGFGTAFNQSPATISNDKVVADETNCSEADTLAAAKLCTTLIVRDDGGHGSAFSIYDEYLVTNKHVVEGAEKLTTFIGENEVSATLWNYSPSYDVAVLKIPKGLSTCKWFNSNNMKVAETVYTVGWPLESLGESTVAKGIYSRMYDSEEVKYIQTDASINSGNSGGPLINKCGVVGINTSKIEEVGVEGLGFVLPSSELIPVVEKLIQEGKASTPIPLNKESYSRRYVPPENSQYSIDIEEVKSYLNNVYQAKVSWKNCSGCNQDDLNRLYDSFDRQISFCNTLIERLSGGKRPSQDDIFMWDAIVKLSYESSAIAARLNSRQ